MGNANSNHRSLVSGYIRRLEPLAPRDVIKLVQSFCVELTFHPILNIKKDVKMDSHKMYKSSVEPDLGLLAVKSMKKLVCIDMKEKKVVFQLKPKCLYRHNSHWLTIDDQKYLSLQTEKNVIKMFKINKKNKSFEFVEDKTTTICLQDGDVIDYFEVDRNNNNVLIVKNKNILENRAIKNAKEVLMSIELKENINYSTLKQLSLSNDGTLCVIGAGHDKSYFYLFEIENKKQHKLTSNKLSGTFAPCFINGDTEFVAVGGGDWEGVEIWNIENKTPAIIIMTHSNWISSTISTNNILAVGSGDKILRLWDVRNWQMFHSSEYGMDLMSLHLTANSKYLTIGGQYHYDKENCVVLEIK